MTRIIILTCLLFVVSLNSANADSLIQTSAKQAIVIDYDTGAVLLQKNADEKMPTSSMSKVMTMYLVFEALKKGDINLDSKFIASEEAWRKQGSKMFVEANKPVKVEDLIRGVIIQSGNDATIVLAEGISGSESAFSESLNRKARELGMHNSNFVNASGWPAADHYSTARDLATLGRALINDFPEHYHYYAEREFTYNNIRQSNRNPLLYRNIGADGIKTGHTEAAGYGLIGSGVEGNRRVVLVVNGLKDASERAQESAKLLEWGLRRFKNIKLFSAGETVESATVAMGKERSVNAVTNEDLLVTVPHVSLKDFKVTARFNEPLVAPISKGQEIGVIDVDVPHIGKIQKKLYAANNVERLGFFSSAIEGARLFLSSLI